MTTNKSNGWLAGENQNHGSRQRETRWLTPRHLVDPLGEFDLDPAGAPGYSLARRTFQIDDGQDGLELPWEGRVWLNPPYGKLAEPFMERLADHNRGTALIFARTETRNWHKNVWPKASGILFLKGRVSFLTAEQKSVTNNSGAPSALIAYGPDDAVKLATSGIPGHFVTP